MFRGAFTALVTPIRGDRLDVGALEAIVEQQIAGGIHGLVPCGTTGEAATLSMDEHVQVIEVVVKAAKGRVPVLAGAGSNSTAEAIELTKACKDLGAAGTLQITPYYNKPPHAGLVRHFTAIAEAVDLPMIVYNVPGRTALDMRPETIAECAKHPNVRGVKEATADMGRVTRLRELVKRDDFDILSGDDFTILPFLACGGHGVISVVSNPAPGVIAGLVNAWRAGDFARALELHDAQFALTRALFLDTNPIPVKAAMAMLGLCSDEMRSPLLALEADAPVRQQVRTELIRLGLAGT
jgi:4-hydroxy-tetrahydrodipicolinate synthase